MERKHFNLLLFLFCLFAQVIEGAEPKPTLKCDPGTLERLAGSTEEVARTPVRTPPPNAWLAHWQKWNDLGAKNPAILEGKRIFEQNLDIFINPTAYLTGPDLSPKENAALSSLALEILLASGAHTPNATHIAEHLAFLRYPPAEKTRQLLGISELVATRNVLIHDLGKEWDFVPPDLRAFLEEIFPNPNEFLPRVIFSHEFGSMALIEQLARKAGIEDQAKINKLKALIAHHNAGYDHNLPGSHFWVGKEGWEKFAVALNDRGISVPLVYKAIPSIAEGGSPETILLTAPDRAVSLTLASQEKFSGTLIGKNKWNNSGLSHQMTNQAQNVMAETNNIVEKLAPQHVNSFSQAIKGFFKMDVKRLNQLSRTLQEMGTGMGLYPDRPHTTPEDLDTSIVYRTSAGKWYRVTKDGLVYTANGQNQWKLSDEFQIPTEQKPNPVRILFRNIIYPDIGFTPEGLVQPSILSTLPGWQPGTQ